MDGFSVTRVIKRLRDSYEKVVITQATGKLLLIEKTHVRKI